MVDKRKWSYLTTEEYDALPGWLYLAAPGAVCADMPHLIVTNRKQCLSGCGRCMCTASESGWTYACCRTCAESEGKVHSAVCDAGHTAQSAYRIRSIPTGAHATVNLERRDWAKRVRTPWPLPNATVIQFGIEVLSPVRGWKNRYWCNVLHYCEWVNMTSTSPTLAELSVKVDRRTGAISFTPYSVCLLSTLVRAV